MAHGYAEAAMTVAGRRVVTVVRRDRPAGRGYTRSQVVVGRKVLATGAREHRDMEGLPQPTLFSPAVGASADGRVLVTWLRDPPARGAGVWAAQRTRGGKWSRPRRLGVRGGYPALAVARDGSALLAWVRGRRIQARVRTRKGHWSAVRDAGTLARGLSVEHLAAAGAGRRWVIGLAASARSLTGVRVVARPYATAGRGDWRPLALADFRYVATGQTAFATDALAVLPVARSDGTLSVAWPQGDGGGIRVMAGDVVTGDGGTRLSGVTALSPAGTTATVQDVAAGPDGRYAVAWVATTAARPMPAVAELGAGGVLASRTGFATQPAIAGVRVAYDPRTGRPELAWGQGSVATGFRVVTAADPPPSSPRAGMGA